MKSMRSMKRILGLSIFCALALQTVPLAAMNAQQRSNPNRVEGRKGVKPGLNKKKQNNNKNKNKVPNRVVSKQKQKANVNESRQTRSVAGRADGFMSFAKKIEMYAAKAKSDHGRTDNGSKPLLDVFHKIKSTSSLKEVKQLIEPIKSLVEKQTPNGKSLEVQEEVGIALLLKSSLPLGEQARSIICEMLHKLDNYISYWHEQKHHPAHYFFHKNPKKWFMGPKQKYEINANLDELDVVRKDHLRLLSKLVEHESYFDQTAPLAEQYEWLAKYLSMISNICYNTQAKLDGIAQEKSVRFEKLLTLVYDMLGRVSYHESNVARALGGANKPGHITRNWIGYSALALGTCAFAWYARKNQERFYNWFDTDVKRGATYVWTSLSGQMKDFYEAMIGKGEAGRSPDYYDQLERDFNRQLDDATQNLEAVRDSLREARDDIQNRVAPRPVPGQNANRDESYQAILLAIANYLEGRDVLVRNQTLAPLPSINNNPASNNASNNNNAPVQLPAQVSLSEIVRNTDLRDAATLSQQERAMLFRTAIERLLVRFGEQEQRKPILSDILRQTLTQAITDIQNATASLQTVKSSNAWLNVNKVIDTATEVSGRVPQLGAAVALFGHVAAIARVVSQDAMSTFGGTGAHLVGNLSDFMDTIAGTIRQTQQVRIENNVEVPVYQTNELGQQVLNENGQPIPVMVPGPLRAGMTSGIDLAKKADQLLTQNKATFILAALIPAGVLLSGIGFGVSKLYKSFQHKPDFKPMREALIEMGHLLNEEGLPKKADDAQLDQGKILYLAWKLKREADNVPSLQREQFLADVNRLGRSDLDHGKRIWTSDKKLRIIDLMYRTYDFLNPAYVAQ